MKRILDGKRGTILASGAIRGHDALVREAARRLGLGFCDSERSGLQYPAQTGVKRIVLPSP